MAYNRHCDHASKLEEFRVLNFRFLQQPVDKVSRVVMFM
jgi:hypothetical protein